jgi:adenylosuccinate lyase
MLARYTRPEMAALWTEEAQFEAWLEVEVAACRAWSDVGVIPKEDVERIAAHARFSVARIHEIEQTTRHDVVAFTRAVSESLGDERKWVHYGLTSSDVVDTAWSLRLTRANALILEQVDRLLGVLAQRAGEHRHTLMMGRTHGIHAEPTSFGLVLALYHAEMQRNRARFVEAAEGVRVGKVSGAVGTFAHTPPEVEARTCEYLGLEAAPISTQVLQRDRHAHYLSVLALIGATLEKMAVEVRHLQRSEVREVEEAFGSGQKGSSAMPHKRNPIGSENVTGIARLLRGYMVAAYENVALWHERDISHSSVERVALPDATTLLHYALHRFAGILETLVVRPDVMRANLDRTYGLYNSQRVMLALVEKGLSREAAYDLVQPRAMQAWETGRPFRALLSEDPDITAHLPEAELDALFDPRWHLRHADEIFARVGLDAG